MRALELFNLAGIVLLALLVRKLVWCLRWLWCHYRGRETPPPSPSCPGGRGGTLRPTSGRPGRRTTKEV